MMEWGRHRKVGLAVVGAPPVVANVVVVIVVVAGTAVAAAGGTAIGAAAAEAAAAEVAADAPYRSTAAQSSHIRTSRPTFLLGPTNDRRCNLSQTHAVASP